MESDRLDLLLGWLATGLGTSAAALQWWGQLGNLLLLALNLALALGGLYLVCLRIRRARMELMRTKEKKEPAV